MTTALTTRPRPGPGFPEGEGAITVDRTPPHDLVAETAVLGCMVLETEAAWKVMQVMKAEYFYADENRVLFTVIAEMLDGAHQVDPVMLRSRLLDKNAFHDAGGDEAIDRIFYAIPSAVGWKGYCDSVIEKAKRRQIIRELNRSINECYESPDSSNEIAVRHEGRFMKLAHQGDTSRPVLIKDEVYDAAEHAVTPRDPNHIVGIPTGFIELDNLVCGLEGGDLIVIAARPSVGKTAFATNILDHVTIELRKTALMFSLEMSKRQVAQRLLAARSTVDFQKFRRGITSESDKERISWASANIADARFFIDDTPSINLVTLRARAKELKTTEGIDLIVVDYLQLMEASERSDSRQQDVAAISRGLKGLAKDLNVPVIALSQLNRNSVTESRPPRMSDLRESGAIEQDADVVMLLHREAVIHRGDQQWIDANPDKINLAELIVAKQRNGPCDTIKLTYLGPQTRFCTYNPGV